MFNLRHKRMTRDRECGLVFQWRLPVGNTVRFLMAAGMVALVSAGLAATVRVHVGGVSRQPERRGSLILIPQGDQWRELEMLAIEAGPMPRREDPLRDPVIRTIFDESRAAAVSPGYRYEPALQPVSVDFQDGMLASEGLTGFPGVLPPLPTPEPPSRNPPLPAASRPLVLSGGGIRAIMPEEAPPASLARGNRYLLEYDAEGRVSRVTTLFSAEPAAGDGGESWLLRVVIEGGKKEGGWTAVEISSGS